MSSGLAQQDRRGGTPPRGGALRRDRLAPPVERRDPSARRRALRAAERVARPAAGRVVVRRHLGAAWRRTAGGGPSLAAAGVADRRRGCARLPPDLPRAAVGGAGRARDHGRGARAASASPATLVRARAGVASFTRAMLARRRGRTDSDRGHLRRRPREPSRGGGTAAPAPRLPGHVLPDRGGARPTARRSGGSACRRRRTAASIHARPLRTAGLRRRRRAVARRPCRGRRAAAGGGRAPPWRGRSRSSIGEDPPAYRLTRSQVRRWRGRASRSGSTRAITDRCPSSRTTSSRAPCDDGRAALEAAAGRPADARSPIRTDTPTSASPPRPAPPAIPTASAARAGRSRRDPIGCCSAAPSCCSRIPARSSWPWHPSYGRID